MGKINNVTITSPTTITLNEDAKKGDYIDLLDLQKVDSSYLNKIVQDQKEKEYAKLLEADKAKWKLEAEAGRLKDEQAYKLNIQSLTFQIEALKKDQDQIRKDASYETEKNSTLRINELNNRIQALESENRIALANKEASFAEEKNTMNMNFSKEKEELKNQVIEAKNALDNLKIQKSALGVKVLGEELETWCDNEYKNYALSGFEDCTWEKDNTLVANEGEAGKGTKADYIFRVFAAAPYSGKNELASVCMDMKNENPESKNKKKNSDFYKKLDSDRTKKNCVYALLVSELEMDKPNDTPIIKVADYPDMYMVRPAYFISFLSIVRSLGKKYQEAKLASLKAQDEFKDSQAILDEFQAMKETYLEKPIEQMNKKVVSILENTEKISKANEDNRALANEIINTTLQTMKTKIERFDIAKLVRKIDKI